MTYLLQVSTCWIVFYGIYLLFLRKETFFSINRYYLLGALMMGLIVPYLGAFIPANEASVEVYQVMTQFSAVEVSPQVYVEEITPIFTWMNLLWTVYIIGGLVVFLRFLYGLNRIYSIYKDAEVTTQTNYTLVESDRYHLPFSFFHFIFISKQLPLNDEVAKVLRHEELHANQWHSLDIIFTELLQVFFWFNPILIFYKDALRQSHEYLADAYVTQDHTKNSYGQLLLQQSTSGLEVALANQFFHSQIKKRITMMYKEKSKRSAMVKYLAAIPVLVAMLLIFSSNQMGKEYSKEELRQDFSKLYYKSNHTTGVAEASKQFTLLLKKYTNDNPDITTEIKRDFQDVAYQMGVAIKYSENENSIDSFSNFHFVVPKENLVDWQNNMNSNSPYYNLLNDKNSPPFIRFGYERGETDPLVLFDGKIINQADYPETGYKSESMIHYNLDRAIELFGKEGMFGAVEYTGIVFNELRTSEIKDFNGRKIIERNWEAFVNQLNKADGKVVINAEANAAGKMVYVEIDSELSTITDRNILKNILSAAKGFKIEKGEGTANGTLIFNFRKNRKSKNHHDEYINQYNYGESNKDRSMIDLIEEFSKDSGDPIFKVVEEMPRFPGCEDMEGTTKEKEECAKQKMLEFVYANLKYPQKARDASVEGMCVVQFIVEKDGSIAEAKIIRDAGAGCGTESMKVVNSFPNWIPGKQKGKVVRVQYTLPVKFKLEDTSDEEKVNKDKTVHVVGFGESNAKAKKESLIINTDGVLEDDIRKVSQEMPRFPGCEDMDGTIAEKEECAKHKMLEYVYRNIKYPKEARAKGIDGMSVVRMVIEKNGSITNITTLRDPGAGTGAEAARIVREMPTWIPGKENGKAVRVQYILPVKFLLEGENKSEPSKVQNLLKGKTSGMSIHGKEDRKIRLRTSNGDGPDPLFIVNGVVKDSEDIESIKPDDIESINIVKGDDATEKYGEAGANGVVEITLKEGISKKEFAYKTALKYTANQFKEIKDISYLLRDMGLREESKAEVLKFSMVKIAENEDAHIEHSEGGMFNKRILKLISEAKSTDRYFFENIVLRRDGKDDNIGAVSVMIVDGLPGIVNSLIVVNGKKVASNWMSNINPEYIESIDILKGEKMIEKYGDIPHNSVVEVTLKPGKNLTNYMIDGKIFGYDFYRKIDKSHIKNERAGTKEEKFMRGMKEDLIVVSMADGYGLSNAYFPGTDTDEASDKALLEFVNKNVKYSKAAIDNNIEGLITVRYTVNENGELADYKIIKSLGWGLDEEVLKVMDNLKVSKGAWTAAQIDQKPISKSAILPVKFKLPKSKKLETIKFSTSPNPSDGNFNVIYQLARNIPVNLTFYTIEGKVAKRMLNLPAENNVNIDLSNQNLPLIYITLEQDGKTKTIKAVFQ